MITPTELDLAVESFYFQRLRAYEGRIGKLMAELLLTQPTTVSAFEEVYKAGFRDAVNWCDEKNTPQITG
jgi:hypothetical protein